MWQYKPGGKKKSSNNLERASVKKLNIFCKQQIQETHQRMKSPGTQSGRAIPCTLFSTGKLLPDFLPLGGIRVQQATKSLQKGNLKCEEPRDFSAAAANFYVHIFTHGYMGILLQGPKTPGWFSNCIPWLCIYNSFTAQLEGEKFRIEKMSRTKYGRK